MLIFLLLCFIVSAQAANVTITGGTLLTGQSKILAPGETAFDPDAQASRIYRLVADDIAQSDGTSVSTWTARVGASAVDTAFGTEPTLKTSIMNGHKVVRFNGVANQNALRADQAITATSLIIQVVGIKRGNVNNSGFLSLGNWSGGFNDYDSTSESSFYEGTGGNEFLAAYRNNSRLATGIHPSTNVAFIYTCRWDGTNNQSWIGDWSSTNFASTGAFNSEKIGIGARLTGSFHDNSPIDIADLVMYDTTSRSTLTNSVGYFQTQYSVDTPRVCVIVGDSISDEGHYDDDLKALWVGTNYYIENLSEQGYNLTQLDTVATTTDLYGRIGGRIIPGKTVVFIWEYANEIGTGSTAQQVVDRTKIIADKVRAQGGKVLVALDFHDATSSGMHNSQPANALMSAQYTTFADGIIDLNLQSLRNDSNNNSDGVHLTSVGDAIIAPILKAGVEALLP